MEDLLLAVRGRPADDCDPGYVGIDGILWLSLLGPGVDQQPIAMVDCRGPFGQRFVVRIAAMGVDGGDRAGRGGQSGSYGEGYR